ncbi:MAG TPA: outer membrane beta-barrel protein [Candidatus Aquilonibacter sp.]|nr:outer membrane beta-barrel protein [Candidatus Aquilonibacter sp.]
MRFIPEHKSRPLFGPWKVMLLWLAAGIPAANAQEVLAPPPAVSATPSAVQQQQDSNPMQVFSPSETGPNFSSFTSPFQWGPVTVRPHVDYQFLYGNGVNSSPGQQQNTIVQTLSPGVLFDLGSHWTLDYTPTLNFYSSGSFQNTVDHSVQLGWGTGYGDWFFSGSQSCSFSSDPTVEIAAQTDQQTYSTALNAVYQINSKLSLDLGLSQNFNYIGNTQSSTNQLQNLSNSREWSMMDWLNYHFRPRLSVGVGVGAGYVNEDAGPDSINEQYQGQLNWRATDKISFQLSGGLQDQQYLSGGAGDLLTPIFSASIQYQPFAQTYLTVGASRTVGTSYFENQVTENTGINADLSQRLLGKLYLDLNGGYGITKYVSTASLSNQIGYGAGRNDDTYSFSVRLTCPLLKRATISVFYQYSKNSSSQTGYLQFYQTDYLLSQSAFAYTSSQIGFEIGYRF